MNSWINEFKLALINEDTGKIAALSQNFSEDMFTSLASAQEAQALIGGAIELLKNKSSHIQNELIKLQKAQKYVTN
ncbi:hypothetical protein [Campylobacter concisus]|uniref:hypothetical protein n=1 Tax=Campylobacter concisus TaxID=199 RepID=UPI000B3D6CC2|nr:hypothetical protein [Campylobacter concisus]MDO4875468.1 hypothetical protein [Campylobacter sp.]OUT14243.1 hypothetical protein B9N64_05935 [Campylobacter concisus]QPH88135.1 hypothetical protein CVT15_05190 [Campylobacter concisus]QPI03081.1 hypothetical protein G5B95_05155 [Campylobacter concisus]